MHITSGPSIKYWLQHQNCIKLYSEETRTDAYVTKGEVQNMGRHRTHGVKTAHVTSAVCFLTCTLHSAQWILWERSKRLMRCNLANLERLTAVCEGRLVWPTWTILILRSHFRFRISTQFLFSKMWHHAHSNSKKWTKITSPYDVAPKQ
jgi:hypothetical protein